MAKLTFAKRSFSAGELSPRICQSRTDLQIHGHCFSGAINLVPFSTGGLSHRPATIAYPELNLTSDASRLISIYLVDDKHMLLIFGDKTLTFVLVDGGKSPKVIKIVKTPYSKEQADQLDYAMSGNLMVLVHRMHRPYQIEIATDGPDFSPMDFSPPPWLGERIVEGNVVEAKLTVTSLISEENYKVVSDTDVFKTTDLGRRIRLGFLPKAWKANHEYSENSYISMGGKVYQSVTRGITSDLWNDKSTATFIEDGSISWKVVSSFQQFSFSKKESQSTVGDISPYYVWGSIVRVLSNKEVVIGLNTAFIIQDNQPIVHWNLSAWGQKEGYPEHVTFYQSRLVFSGTGTDYTSLYFSEYGKFNSFSASAKYNTPDYLEALSVAVTDDIVREIRWIAPFGTGLLIGCDSSLWLFCIQLDQGFNFVLRKISGSGVSSCSPLSVGESLFFVCGAGRRIKAIDGNIEQGFRFTDITQFVDHLFTFRIKQLVFQADPHSIVWVIDRSKPSDLRGYNLLGCRFSSERETDFAWHAHRISTPSHLLSLATSPSLVRGETDVWILVARPDGASDQVLLERLGRFHHAHNCHADGAVLG
ncbi:MAG: hypothetical protein C4617_05870 [Candidatus Liberibacter europaeus]|uniref:Uncharacterized protein n=1 Tax=Candidatus Liberibacter europaeus TaxID=744859 RepID=A0A2T4VW61_9HYPH|nr:hypothetical protein [Candidatus Liberibacter europaeus]PTL86018.1 MAG: hypothetical protein C4617_05870 [Candidatus Liberibacter europaeus]